mmetsp:Transcript_6132/g.18031  ORF Transcript_6132/g.18031 Transcript_6132/m.18031 type:complete len:287 (+) Transcript_6132:2943-3803(+)
MVETSFLFTMFHSTSRLEITEERLLSPGSPKYLWSSNLWKTSTLVVLASTISKSAAGIDERRGEHILEEDARDITTSLKCKVAIAHSSHVDASNAGTVELPGPSISVKRWLDCKSPRKAQRAISSVNSSHILWVLFRAQHSSKITLRTLLVLNKAPCVRFEYPSEYVASSSAAVTIRERSNGRATVATAVAHRSRIDIYFDEEQASKCGINDEGSRMSSSITFLPPSLVFTFKRVRMDKMAFKDGRISNSHVSSPSSIAESSSSWSKKACKLGYFAKKSFACCAFD